MVSAMSPFSSPRAARAPSRTGSSASCCPYLRELGYGPVETGVVATATLTGSALLTLAIGFNAHRASGRALLMGASLLMIGTGLAFAGIEEIWPLLVVSFLGTLNPSSGDVSAFL